MKALIVDDAPMIRKILKGILEKELGYQTEEAENGLEALAKIKKRDYDIVVTDWNMPYMTGLELVERIRSMEDPKKARIPVLMVTAEAKKENIILALKAGVNNYIVKPFTAETVKQKLDAIFSKRKAG